MRITVNHETRYEYAAPVRSVSQVLRLTPRSHDGQHVVQWRLDVDVDSRIREGEDAFGNCVQYLSADGPFQSLTLTVQGVVETSETQGVLSERHEPLPPETFLRSTPLTAPDSAIVAFAEDTAAGRADRLDRLHALLGAIHREMRFEVSSTNVGTSAVEAFASRRGVCQDLSHVFIACARHLGIPARYVSGHLARADGVVEQEASHAWAEALVEGLGWVGFDPANGICPTERHVRVACGFDYVACAPVRGTRLGGGDERLSVRLSVAEADRAPVTRRQQMEQAQS